MFKKNIWLPLIAILLLGCSKTSNFEAENKFFPVDRTTLTLNSWEFSKFTYDFSINARDLFFVNSQIGFVAGYNGDIYRTTDSGETWTNRIQALLYTCILFIF